MDKKIAVAGETLTKKNKKITTIFINISWFWPTFSLFKGLCLMMAHLGEFTFTYTESMESFWQMNATTTV